jgi:hypothetical protein
VTLTERTSQQFDPAGSSGVHWVTIALSSGAFLFAVVQSIRGIGEVSFPALAILAVVLLAAAGSTLVIASSPSHAPFVARSHALVLVFALAAILAEAGSQFATNTHIRDDWGPTSLGILFVALGPYRPALEIAASGILSAILVGFVTLLEIDSFAGQAPAIAFVVMAIIPMVALCFSASMFSMGVVASIERFQKRADEASRSLAREFRDQIARSVRTDRVTILSRDVLPFFATVLERDTITDEDKLRARQIAESIRRVMVHDVDRSWLEAVIDLAGGSGQNSLGASREIVSDHDRVAASMSTDQRTAMRALLVALIGVSGVERQDLRILLSLVDGRCHARIGAQLSLTDYAMRSTFAPFFAVLRAVFTNLEVDFVHSTLTLRFSYEQ